VKRLFLSAALCLGAVAACTLDVTDFTGKKCESAGDCPDTHVCVSARPGQGRTCEVLGLPGLSDGGEVDAGPVPTWCEDVQPLLAASCVSSCHGEDRSGSNDSPFRLDYYAPDAGDAGELPGAQSKAERIRQRAAISRDMPPSGSDVPFPTEEERALLARWAAGGAPLCPEDTADAGLDDGGSDAGLLDAGTDAGP